MTRHAPAAGADDDAVVFEAPPVRNGDLARSLLTSMQDLGATDEMLARASGVADAGGPGDGSPHRAGSSRPGQ